MKIKRNRKSKKGRIEIIPMIDVMFFLLATFMIASLSMQRLSGLKVNMEQGKAERIRVEDQVTLTIDAHNRVFLNKEEVAVESLKSRLQPALQNTDKTVIIISDRHAFQGVVMQSMIQARAAGAQNFSMMVRD